MAHTHKHELVDSRQPTAIFFFLLLALLYMTNLFCSELLARNCLLDSASWWILKLLFAVPSPVGQSDCQNGDRWRSKWWWKWEWREQRPFTFPNGSPIESCWHWCFRPQIHLWSSFWVLIRIGISWCSVCRIWWRWKGHPMVCYWWVREAGTHYSAIPFISPNPTFNCRSIQASYLQRGAFPIGQRTLRLVLDWPSTVFFFQMN